MGIGFAVVATTITHSAQLVIVAEQRDHEFLRCFLNVVYRHRPTSGGQVVFGMHSDMNAWAGWRMQMDTSCMQLQLWCGVCCWVVVVVVVVVV